MSKHYEQDKLQERYGQSEAGNFFVRETIGVPHPYCITPIHVEVASKHHGGMLGEAAIKDAERTYGGRCGICKGKLKFNEHETALLVACKGELKDEEGKASPELHQYLLSIKDKCEEDGYAGFAFVQA
jgi:hypothetical protein